MDTLAKLFGSDALVKLMRLFINHPDRAFETSEITKRCRITPQTARRDLAVLKSMDFIFPKNYTVVTQKRGKNTSRKAKGYRLNIDFPLMKPLTGLLFNSEPFQQKEIMRRLKGTGSYKCVFISGVFTQDPSSRVDLLLVGDSLKKRAIDNAIKGMEAELGKELRYAIFDTPEFKYRIGIYDKFIRDIIDYPHEKVLDKLGY